MIDHIDHDYELEKHYHPENFEPDYDTENDLQAELDNEFEFESEEQALVYFADESKKERRIIERMDRTEDQGFRWGDPRKGSRE